MSRRHLFQKLSAAGLGNPSKTLLSSAFMSQHVCYEDSCYIVARRAGFCTVATGEEALFACAGLMHIDMNVYEGSSFDWEMVQSKIFSLLQMHANTQAHG